MATDVKTIIARIKNKPTRGRTVLYLDRAVLRAFQVYCKNNGVSASRVIEEIMKDEMASSRAAAVTTPGEKLHEQLQEAKAHPLLKGKKVSKKIS